MHSPRVSGVAKRLQPSRLFTASVVVLALGLLTSLVGLFKEQWVALRFGLGDELEVFTIGLTLPLFVTGLIGSSISAVVIPAYARARRDQQDDQFVAGVGALFQTFLLLLVALTCAVSWFLMPYLASGFEADKLERVRWMAMALTPIVALQGMTSLADGILNARSQYVFSSSSMLLVPVGSVLALLVVAGGNAWLLCAGLYLGASAKLLFQMVAAPRVMGALLKPALLMPGKAWKEYRALIGEFFALMFSSAILGLMPVIAQAYAAALPAGSVAGLSYANKLVGVGLALLSGVINAVVFPMLAEQAAHDKADSVRLGTRWALLVVAGGLSLLLPALWLLEPVVRIVFERGAFTQQATQEVVHILRYLLPHLPFYVAGLVLARLVVTLGISRVFVLGNVISLGLYWLACETLVKRYGISGIGLALTLVYIVSFVYLHAAIRREVN